MRLRFGPLAVFALLTSACVALFDFADYDLTPADRAVADASTPLVDFRVIPISPISVERGATVEVPVVIERAPGFDAPIVVEIAELPAGIVIQAASIAAAATRTALSVTATESVALGVELVVRVILRTASLAREARLSILARGAPGTLDPSFGDGGVVLLTPLGITNEFGVAVALDDGGSAYLGGRTSGGGMLARVGTRGETDPAFPAVGTRPETVGQVLLDAEGRVVVGLDGELRLARLLVDGGVDPSFGDAGEATCPDCAHAYGAPYGVAPRGDGWLFSYVEPGKGGALRLGAFDDDGARDLAFGDGGLAELFDPPDAETAIVLTETRRRPDGRHVVAAALQEFTSQAALGGAVFVVNGATLERAVSVDAIRAEPCVRDDGARLLVAGHATTAASPVLIAAYRADGGSDDAFGDGGVAVLPMTSSGSPKCRLVGAADGATFVVAGRIAKLDERGHVVSRFGVGGMTSESHGSFFLEWGDAAITRDGRIVAVGTYEEGGDNPRSGVAVARYWP